MAALRHAAKRILLAGQAPRSIRRAAITEEQRHLPPTVIHGRSSAYPRRFSSNQRGESDPDKERVVRVICRTAKAVSTIVVVGLSSKFALMSCPALEIRFARLEGWSRNISMINMTNHVFLGKEVTNGFLIVGYLAILWKYAPIRKRLLGFPSNWFCKAVAMAALRHAAKRILLAGQAPQPICRAAITQEQRCLLPTAIHGRSHAYPRRFSSSQRGESDPDKERAVRVIFRAAKAVSTIVVCGFVIKVCLDELARTGDPLREARGMVKEYQDVMQVLRGISPEKAANSALQEEARIAAMRAEKEAWIAALRAKLKSIQEDAERGGGAGGGESA